MKAIPLLPTTWHRAGLAMAGLGTLAVVTLLVFFPAEWKDYQWPALLLLLGGCLMMAFAAQRDEDEWLTHQRLRAWGWSVLVVTCLWATVRTGLFAAERYYDQQMEATIAGTITKLKEGDAVHLDINLDDPVNRELSAAMNGLRRTERWLQHWERLQILLLVVVFLVRFHYLLARTRRLEREEVA